MHQHHAVVRHRAVRAPVPAPREGWQAVGARVAHGTQVISLVHHHLLRFSNKTRLKVGRIERHADSRKHVHVSPPGTIGRKRIILQVLQISCSRLFGFCTRSNLCTEKLRGRPAEFILAVFAIVHVIARLHIGRLLVERLRILLCPAIRLLGCLEHLVRISLVHVTVHYARLRHHGRKVKRRRHVLENRVTRCIILFREYATAKLERRHLMVNAAILVLHGKHPVQVVANFFKKLRILCKFARNVPGERIGILREVLVNFEQSPYGNAGVHDVLAVVARIVPAASRLDCLAGTLAASYFVCTIDNDMIVHVARSAGPLARILRFKRHARTLVIEPLEGSLHQVCIDILPHDNRGAHILAATEQAVGSRSLDGGNIECLHFLTAVIPVVDHRGIQLKHRLAVQVADFEPIRITARVDHLLLGIRRIAQLVHQGARKYGRSQQKRRSRCRHALPRESTFANIHD